MGNWKAAVVDYSKALHINPKDRFALEARAYARYRNDKPNCIGDFTLVMNDRTRTKITRAHALTLRGIVLSESGCAASAVHDFKTALELDPTNQRARTMLAEVKSLKLGI